MYIFMAAHSLTFKPLAEGGSKSSLKVLGSVDSKSEQPYLLAFDMICRQSPNQVTSSRDCLQEVVYI